MEWTHVENMEWTNSAKGRITGQWGALGSGNGYTRVGVGIGYRGSGIGNPCGPTRAIQPPELRSAKGGGSGRDQTPQPHTDTNKC